MSRAPIAFALLACLAGSALAEPLTARNADEVRLTVAQKTRKALRLKPASEGWRLQLGGVGERGVAEVFDVTPNTPARTFTLPVSGGDLLFDRTRFSGGHVYRVQLRAGDRPGASGFVFLVADPPAKELPRKRAERVRFDANEPAQPSDDSIQPVAKAPL